MKTLLKALLLLATLVGLFRHASSQLVARTVRVQDQAFVNAETREPIVMSGPNVVVKG